MLQDDYRSFCRCRCQKRLVDLLNSILSSSNLCFMFLLCTSFSLIQLLLREKPGFFYAAMLQVISSDLLLLAYKPALISERNFAQSFCKVLNRVRRIFGKLANSLLTSFLLKTFRLLSPQLLLQENAKFQRNFQKSTKILYC